MFFHKFTVSEEKNLDIDFETRREKLEGAKKLIEEKGGETFKDSLNDFFFDLPVRDKTVLLLGLGKNVRGNLKYILDVLNSDPLYEGFEIFVRTSPDTDQKVRDFIAQYGWKNTKTVPDDPTYDRLLESAKYMLTEVFFAGGWIKKEGQITINTWHGTPLKKLGLAKNFRTCHRNGNTQVNFIDADYLLYPNEYTRKNLIDSYGIEHLAKGKKVMLGYPRTGGILMEQKDPDEALKKKLAPGGERIYAYMPTFRDYLEVEEVIGMTKKLLDELDKGLKNDQILYVNLHHKVSDSLDYSAYKHIRQFPPDVDSYRLLAHTDALITDYSSVFFDYLAGRSQIVLYHADYKKYKKRRGTYMDLLSLPFDKAVTAKGILEALDRGKTYDDSEAAGTFCAYDGTDNASKLCGLFLGREDGIETYSFDAAGIRKKLIFSQALEACPQTAMLHRALKGADKNGKEYIIGCDQIMVDDNRDSAYPMLFENGVFGMNTDMHISSVGKSFNALIEQGKIGFDEWVDILKYDFAAQAKRGYGRSQFDEIWIYDVTRTDLLLMLASMRGKKLLFINQKVADAMEKDKVFKEAVKYVLPFMSAVIAEDKNTVQRFTALAEESVKPQLLHGYKGIRALLEM